MKRWCSLDIQRISGKSVPDRSFEHRDSKNKVEQWPEWSAITNRPNMRRCLKSDINTICTSNTSKSGCLASHVFCRTCLLQIKFSLQKQTPYTPCRRHEKGEFTVEKMFYSKNPKEDERKQFKCPPILIKRRNSACRLIVYSRKLTLS